MHGVAEDLPKDFPQSAESTLVYREQDLSGHIFPLPSDLEEVIMGAIAISDQDREAVLDLPKVLGRFGDHVRHRGRSASGEEVGRGHALPRRAHLISPHGRHSLVECSGWLDSPRSTGNIRRNNFKTPAAENRRPEMQPLDAERAVAVVEYPPFFRGWHSHQPILVPLNTVTGDPLARKAGIRIMRQHFRDLGPKEPSRVP